jgi:hypothetical protein
MSETKYRTCVASAPDRDELVAEVWVEDNLLAEIRRFGKGTMIELYSNPAGGPWSLECDSLFNALAEAKVKLLT